jgi:tetratricopeptide (TPR) repeat protein
MMPGSMSRASPVSVETLENIDRALERDPSSLRLRIDRARCLLALGRRPEALAAVAAAERVAGNDAHAWDAFGTLYSYAADQRGALAAYDRAVAIAPESPEFRFNRASVRRFVGDLAGAESDYDAAIARRPGDFEAYLNRTELRVQTRERNHVAELEAAAVRAAADWRGEVQVRFALAKEYEDLGEHAKSFEQLRRGASRRREHLRYDIGTDVATAEWIMEAFPVGTFAAAPPMRGAAGGPDDPIFIVGLPRSGTTVVERILGSHSTLTSAGELDSFALALVDAARRRNGGKVLSRRELVAASATLDFPALGRDYLQRARLAFGGGGRFIDKMPLNYLYAGLIRQALPNARIIHVTRHPMAVCYAMYKTLFKSGYPFSYDLGEIAQYYIAYRRLMQHWRSVLGEALHETRYESLVSDQLGETRKLLEYCGLEWEDACLKFHENPAPSTTASASQVRRPLYDSSVSQWRSYETELAELKRRLEAAGIDME